MQFCALMGLGVGEEGLFGWVKYIAPSLTTVLHLELTSSQRTYPEVPHFLLANSLIL